MPREDRRKIKKDARDYIKKTQAFVLVYLDKDSRFQVVGDVSKVPIENNTMSQQTICSLFSESMSMCSKIHHGEQRELDIKKQAEQVQQAREKRSEEMAAEITASPPSSDTTPDSEKEDNTSKNAAPSV